MTFASFEFVGFFLVVLAGRALSRTRSTDNWILLLASYAFIASWSAPSVLLLTIVSLIDFRAGQQIHRSESQRERRRWLMLSITANLGLLGFFKYTNFLLANAGWAARMTGFDTQGWHLDIILPVGISFFTFKSMSYTLDVYRGSITPCASVRDYMLFVSFFPQLLAGPIVRASVLLPQIGQRVRSSAFDVEAGLAQFVLGAVKKLAIADQVAGHVTLIFSAPGQFDALTLLQGAVGYAIQIYCDFSGYSDMAIGAARIMGFRSPENFQLPYSARDVTDFWRRWHISLSSWLRDYAFLPLAYALSRRLTAERYAGVRVDVVVYVAAILATFTLCGLWHGASWTFVLWGALHGLALAVHRAWKLRRPHWSRARSPWAVRAGRLAAHLATLSVVLVGWILFRSESVQSAGVYLARLAGWESGGTRMPSPYIIPAFFVVVAAHLLTNRDGHWAQEVPSRPVPARILWYASMIVVLVSFGAADAVPFIYSQF